MNAKDVVNTDDNYAVDSLDDFYVKSIHAKLNLLNGVKRNSLQYNGF